MSGKDPIFTVYGAFAPTPSHFSDERRAIEYAKSCVNDWAPDVRVVKSFIIWEAGDE